MKIKIIICIIITMLLVTFTGCIEEETIDKERKTIEISNEFLGYLSQKDFETSFTYFSYELKNALPLDDFEDTWNIITNTYGDFISVVNISYSYEDGYDIVRLNCTFDKGYIILLRFVFDTDEKISGFWADDFKPINSYIEPDYANIESFSEYDVQVGSEWELPATISIPNGQGTYPAIILVHGSGPNDKDETIGANKPFKDIAWGLATKGFIVLRYDKRTKIYPEEIASDKNFTPKEEVIDDAIEAVKLLQNYEEVDQSNIYILGHSFGAMLAPKIATLNDNISGAILLASPARPLEDLIYNQTKYLAELDGNIDEDEQAAIDIIKGVKDKIKKLNITDDEVVLSIYKPYWEYLHSYDQVQATDDLEIPILLCQGKRDYQVTYEDDFAIWNETLIDNVNVNLNTYESLNHLFISGEGTPTNTEYMIAGHVSEDVIDDIFNWINEMLQ